MSAWAGHGRPLLREHIQQKIGNQLGGWPLRAFFREQARRYNSHTVDPTSVVPRMRTMVLAFGLLANVGSRSNLCDAAQTAPNEI